MDKYDETFETWNNIALLYEQKFMDLDLYNSSYDFVCMELEMRDPKVLEIGCGPGNITKYLLSKRPDFDIFGIDVAPKMIELAKRNNPKANFAQMDCRKISSLDTKYDAIICGFCLPYLSVQESEKLIEDAKNLLNNSGLIYLSFVEGHASESDYKEGSGGRVFFYYHDLAQLSKQLQAHQFEEMQLFKVPYPGADGKDDIHTIVVARKK